MTNPKEMKKEPYQEPKVIDYGNIEDLTRKTAAKSGVAPAMNRLPEVHR